jgi:hypothetical protein
METADLAEAIASGIALRGFYLLMNDAELDLVGGSETLQKLDHCAVMQKVAEFAGAHGWYVTRDPNGLIFRSKGHQRRR